jgi:hypothetical protein
MSTKKRQWLDAALKAQVAPGSVTERGDGCRVGGQVSASPEPDLLGFPSTAVCW